MAPISTWHDTFADLARAGMAWLGGWWQIIRSGAVILVLALSPSSYAGDTRSAMARHLYLGTAPVLMFVGGFVGAGAGFYSLYYHIVIEPRLRKDL